MKNLKLITLLIINCLFVFFTNDLKAQATRKYVNNYLKYNPELHIQYANDSSFMGSLNLITKNGTAIAKSTSFSGFRKGNSLNVVFNKNPPVLNENLKWTKNSWKIISVDRVDTIIIRFMEKELNSKVWKETEYEFIEEIE